MYKNQILSLQSTMPFGKYQGQTIKQIIDENRGYVEWLINNIDNMAFDEKVLEILSLSDSLLSINAEKLKQFRSEVKHYEKEYDDYGYNDYDSNNWEEDNWYAMTDGMYGDMPDGFDGDYSFLGY